MPESMLRNILEQQTERIKNSYSGDHVFAIIEIIRSLDYQSFMLSHNLKPSHSQLLSKYHFGWGLAFRAFYDKLSLTDEIPLFQTTYPPDQVHIS